MQRCSIGRAAVVFLVLGGLHAEEFKKYYHKSFEVKPGQVLQLSHGDGDVIVTAWDREVAEVDVVYHVVTRGLKVIKQEFRVDFEEDENRIEIRGHESCVRVGLGSCKTEKYVYRLRAPAGVTLVLRGDDGDVDVSDWRGLIDCKTLDGDVTLSRISTREVVIEMDDGDLLVDDLQGSLQVVCGDGTVAINQSVMAKCVVDLEDGRLRLDRCAGSFRLRTHDGDILGRNLEAGRLDVQVDEGDVTLKLDESSAADISVVTGGGDVALALWPTFSGEYFLQTQDGTLHLLMPGVGRKAARPDQTQVAGRIGRGSNQVRVFTQSGNIELTL